MQMPFPYESEWQFAYHPIREAGGRIPDTEPRALRELCVLGDQ